VDFGNFIWRMGENSSKETPISDLDYFDHWTGLAYEIQLEIFYYFSPFELCSLCSICKTFQDICQRNELWKRLCHSHERMEVRPTDNPPSWKEFFKIQYQKLNLLSVEIQVDIILIGSPKVGKTQIFNRFCNVKFSPRYWFTDGINFEPKMMILGGESTKVYLIDIDTTSSFPLKNPYRCILVYDVTNLESFEYAISEIETANLPLSSVLLMGNKIDLKDQRVIQKIEGEKIAQKYGILFAEVSAKENWNIAKSIKLLLQRTEPNMILKN